MALFCDHSSNLISLGCLGEEAFRKCYRSLQVTFLITCSISGMKVFLSDSQMELLCDLAGLCTNESCPYRHVNVNPRASVCEGFLRGYCEDGDMVSCHLEHLQCLFKWKV